MTTEPTAPRTLPRTVAIAGAAGFVGSALTDHLASTDRVLSLGRRQRENASPGAAREDGPPEPGIEPRRCDLFSVRETRDALVGAEVAVYLVHSMSPNARLTQGRFEDLDLLLADNFGRAAAEAGVRRIVYLGGLLPADGARSLSPHLRSRREVESALGAHGVPVTAVRAGLVVGSEGSSLNLLVRLVERLPMMVCPSWTSSRTQPIALSDVIEILAYCCHEPSTEGRVAEVGGPDVMTYRDMMRRTAEVLGRRRPMLPVPFVSPSLSELWVALVTGAPRSLVRPLIESLRHSMVVTDPWLQREMGLPGRPFEESLREAISGSRAWKRPIARSVQRLPLPPGRDAGWLAEAYMTWLPRFLPLLIRVERNDACYEIGLRGLRTPMLRLRRRHERDDAERCPLDVVGGLLAHPAAAGHPRLEFRVAPLPGAAICALQDYAPRMPWWLYLWTQAPLHAFIMRAFGRWLRRQADAPGLRAAAGTSEGRGAST
jgi:uncharacterized protein YbjT (DUF2867 family)